MNFLTKNNLKLLVEFIKTRNINKGLDCYVCTREGGTEGGKYWSAPENLVFSMVLDVFLYHFLFVFVVVFFFIFYFFVKKILLRVID